MGMGLHEAIRMGARIWVVGCILVLLPSILSATDLEQRSSVVSNLDIEIRFEKDVLPKSAEIRLIAVASNRTSEPQELCGFFHFGVVYSPSDETRQRVSARLDSLGVHSCTPYPTFIVLDPHLASRTLDCEPVELSPGGALVDTLTFDYDPNYFVDYPGFIEVDVRLLLGEPDTERNNTLMASSPPRLLEIPVP
jgi:hypothetical protein